MSMHMIISLVLWLIMGSLNAYFAYQRGRDPIAWFMLGILLGIIGLIVLFILPKLPIREQEDPELAPDSYAIKVQNAYDYTTNEWYFLDASRKQQGPVKFRSLQSEWLDGKINSDSFVWSEGMPDWSRISQIPGFKDVLSN